MRELTPEESSQVNITAFHYANVVVQCIFGSFVIHGAYASKKHTLTWDGSKYSDSLTDTIIAVSLSH